ncbi:N-acetylglucosamine kinase [Humitalea rosea]|uniref:N-acetylglucosamine kinase n=1 Tax=Humitalea rosea TaxID=990373 RepID=A0A2W7K3N5_9PROT|nr:ROK family protein [Humitalea rosea]PZW42230.1 N-acetylglucosamine kinase [Humitalea rosea]
MRIGIDLGGTKIEIVALDATGQPRLRRRIPTPHDDYAAIITSVAGLVEAAEAEAGETATVGIGIPGSPSPETGLVRNANTQALNGQPFGADLCARLGREVRVANDANCLALSEATDGAGAGFPTVFAVILGTGVGGGIVVGGKVLEGLNGIAGEWGHTPLPWMTEEEFPGPMCWCGRRGCLETFLSGPALAADSGATTGRAVETRAAEGDPRAQAALDRHAHRLARALAMIANILDPHCIVLAGGVSKLQHLYEQVPDLMAPWMFGDLKRVVLREALHGDSSGVFGAARLWD